MNMRDRLSKAKFAEEEVTIEIDGEQIGVMVREMTAGECGKYQSSLYKLVNNTPIVNMENAQAKLIAACLFDKDGNKVYEDKDIELINRLPANVVTLLFEVAGRVNNLERNRIKN